MCTRTLGYLTLNAAPLDTVAAAAAAGWRSVGLRITGRRIGDDGPQVIGNPEMIGNIRDLASRSGIILSSIMGYHLFPEVKIEHLQQMLETASALGTRRIVTMSYQPDVPKFEALFDRYCELAGEKGLEILVEFCRYSEIKTIHQAAQLLHRINRPNVGLVLDPLHLCRSGGALSDVLDIDPNLISIVQICDARLKNQPLTDQELIQEARYSRMPPGLGELPLEQILKALPRSIEVEYEVPNPELTASSLEEQARIARTTFDDFLTKIGYQ